MNQRYLKYLRGCALVLVSVLAISCATQGEDEFSDDYTDDDSAVAASENKTDKAEEKDFSALDSLEGGTDKPEAKTDKAAEPIGDDALLAPNEGAVAASQKDLDKSEPNGFEIPPDKKPEENVLTEIPTEPTLSKPKKSKKSSVDAILSPAKSTISQSGGGGAGPRVPSIPGAAIKRNGILLNRFYFARKGDTPDSLAMLMYGDKARKKDLVSWNGKSWTPGKLIYYASPTQAEDREMRSFYQERSVPPEEYTVNAGENIYKIATSKLGAKASWKEIAVINGLSTPSQIEPGSKIALYPSNLTPYSQQPGGNANAAATAATPPTAVQPPPQQVVQTPPTPEQPPQQIAQNEPPPVAAVDPAQQVPEPQFGKKKKSGGGLDFGRLIEQNMFAIAIGGGVFVLVVLLMLVSGRKKARPLGDDFGEDAFAAPKAKRK